MSKLEKRRPGETNRVLLTVRIDPVLLKQLKKKAPRNTSALVEQLLARGISESAA